MGQQPRVFVADDHPVYREGLVRALQESRAVDVVGEASDGDTALAAIRRLVPDVALLDVRMPTLDGISVTKGVVGAGLPTRVVLLSAQEEGELILEAVSAGASAYLAKSAASDDIRDTVLRVAQGEKVLGPTLDARLLESLRSRKPKGARLSARELEILSLIAEGNTTPQIAELLYVSPETVKTHLQNAFEKLEVSDRAAAVAEALRRGLLK